MSVTFLDFDTDGDGVADYRIVGDYNGNGFLEWDDIQAALDTFCDPSGDGVQDAPDGKMKDLDGDGRAEPFCGTLHILPGIWVSRTQLDPDIYNKKDDQIYLSNYQGLSFRGSGIGSTVLKTVYSRQEFCRKHHQPGCGGICSSESKGNLTISDFTFEGLEARTWMDKMDCDGDGLPAEDPSETDEKVRTHQSAIVVNGEPGLGARNVKLHNVEVTQADYNGFYIQDIRNLHLSNLRVLSAGSAGIWLSGLQYSLAENLLVENCDNGLGVGLWITSWAQETGKPAPLKTLDLTIDGLVSRHNHYGLSLTAGGVGGISDVTVRNFEIVESRDRTGATDPFTQFGIRITESCLWDADGDGLANDPCYATNLTFDSGKIIGCPGYSLSIIPTTGGPDRSYVFRNIHFEGNGYGNIGPETRDVDISGLNGVVFEGNTVVGGDYDQDGSPDVHFLLVGGSHNAQIQNNHFQGLIKPGGAMALLGNYTATSGNSLFADNALDCSSFDCLALFVHEKAFDTIIQGNRITLTGDRGTGIRNSGNGSIIRENVIEGGNVAIDSFGSGTILSSNHTSTLDAAFSAAEIQISGAATQGSDNICTPADRGKYCIEIEETATDPLLQGNVNMTTPERIYLYR